MRWLARFPRWGSRRVAVLVAAAVIVAAVLNWRRDDAPGPAKFPPAPPPAPRVVVDPGHGGIDGGTCGNGLKESELNLELARLLRRRLEELGIAVTMTREEDIALSDTSHREDLQRRVEVINASSPAAFVSVHANWSSDPRRAGALVLYAGEQAQSRRLAQAVQRELNRVQAERGVRHSIDTGDLYLFRHARAPGILVEFGFLSNPVDCRLLRDRAYQSRLVEAVARGMAGYLQSEAGSPLGAGSAE